MFSIQYFCMFRWTSITVVVLKVILFGYCSFKNNNNNNNFHPLKTGSGFVLEFLVQFSVFELLWKSLAIRSSSNVFSFTYPCNIITTQYALPHITVIDDAKKATVIFHSCEFNSNHLFFSFDCYFEFRELSNEICCYFNLSYFLFCFKQNVFG